MNRKIKVFFGDKRLKDIYPYATRFQVFKYHLIRFVRKVVIASFLIGVVYGSFQVGRITTEPRIVEAIKEVKVEIDSKAPVMERIARCESGNMHFKNGQVIINVNTNGTYDMGVYQINSIWNKKAGEMGYNLSIEKDNREFANYLYKNFGTAPWDASRKNCWNK